MARNRIHPLGALALLITVCGEVASADGDAWSGIRISDGASMSLTLTEKNCWLTDKRNEDKKWLDVRVFTPVGSETYLQFRLGEEYGRPVEQMAIQLGDAAPYGVPSLFDRLEQELEANIESWSPEQIAEQDDKLDAADGAPNEALQLLQIAVDGQPSTTYFDNVWETERFPVQRTLPVSISVAGLPVTNDGTEKTADIALAGACRIMPVAT